MRETEPEYVGQSKIFFRLAWISQAKIPLIHIKAAKLTLHHGIIASLKIALTAPCNTSMLQQHKILECCHHSSALNLTRLSF